MKKQKEGSDPFLRFVIILSVSLFRVSSRSKVALSLSLAGVGACHFTLCGLEASRPRRRVRKTGVTVGDRADWGPPGGWKLEPEDLLDFLTHLHTAASKWLLACPKSSRIAVNRHEIGRQQLLLTPIYIK